MRIASQPWKRFFYMIMSVTLGILTIWGFLQTIMVSADPLSQTGLWENMGLYGGSVQDAAVDPVTGRVYIVTNGYPGLYYSDNNGAHWTGIEPGYAAAQRVIVDTTGRVYANLNTLHFSDDGGETWSSLLDSTIYPRAATIQGFDVDIHNPNHIVLGTGAGGSDDNAIYYSFNRGANWTAATVPLHPDENGASISIDPSNPGGQIVYAAARASADFRKPSHIYRSSDGGQSFAPVFTAPSGTQMNVVAANNFGTVFAGSNNGLYRSNDGTSWEKVSDVSGYINFIEFSPKNHNIVHVNQRISHDNGHSWSYQNTSDFIGLSEDNPMLMFTSSSLGIRRSSNGGANWEEIVHGIEGLLIWDVVSDPLDKQILYVGASRGVARSFDGGETWVFPLPGVPGTRAIAVDPHISGKVYISSGEWLYKSDDYGDHWEVISPQPIHGKGEITDILIDPQNSNRLYLTCAGYDSQTAQAHGGLYISDDGGNTWRTTPLEGLPVIRIVGGIDQNTNQTILFAGMGDLAGLSYFGGVFRSLDSGQSWQQAPDLADYIVLGLDVHPDNPDTIFAGTYRGSGTQPEPGLFRSTDRGTSWEALEPLDCPSVHAIEIDKNSPNQVFVSYCGNIIQTLDHGDNWQPYYEGRPGDWFPALHVPLLPATPVDNLTASVLTDSIRLDWLNPNDDNLAGVGVYYLTDTFPTAHNVGISLTQQVSLPDTPGAYTHTNIITDTLYYYAAFAFDDLGRYSYPAVVSVTTPITPGQTEVQNIFSTGSTSPNKTTVVYLAASSGLFRRTENAYQIHIPLVLR